MIFLHSGIFVDFFAIFTCHALVGYRTQLNSFLSNVAFNGLANGTDLNSVCAINCEIYVKNIQIYIHNPSPFSIGFASGNSTCFGLHPRATVTSHRAIFFAVDRNPMQYSYTSYGMHGMRQTEAKWKGWGMSVNMDHFFFMQCSFEHF